MKVCSCCKIAKEISEFGKNKSKTDGLTSLCKRCISLQDKRWYANPNNAARKREKRKQWSADPKNKKQHYKTNKDWIAKNQERHRSNIKRWKTKNIERRRQYMRHYRAVRIKTDPLFKLRQNLISRLHRALKAKSWTKNSRIKDILGCTLEELLQHLGPVPAYDHHIDHICPCSQAQTEEELYKLFHYTNLRYFPAADNISKLDSRTEEGEALCLSLLGRAWIDI